MGEFIAQHAGICPHQKEINTSKKQRQRAPKLGDFIEGQSNVITKDSLIPPKFCRVKLKPQKCIER
jgi:hypothetical protein